MDIPKVNKITLVPLPTMFGDHRLPLPFDLGNGLRIANRSDLLEKLDTKIFERYVAPEELQQIRSASYCLEHSFQDEPIHGGLEMESLALMKYVVAHLRLIVPNQADANEFVKGIISAESLDSFGFGRSPGPIILEDCEWSIDETKTPHLELLRDLLPWVLELRQKWRNHYPLYICLHLSEKAYIEEDPRIRHLLRVMALEALFSTKTVFGKKALKSRLVPYLGGDTDLYTQYQCSWRNALPAVKLSQVIDDICDLRNTIAHGDQVEVAWLKKDFREGMNETLCYADALREFATSLVSLTMLKILGNQHQANFSDKVKLEKFLPA